MRNKLICLVMAILMIFPLMFSSCSTGGGQGDTSDTKNSTSTTSAGGTKARTICLYGITGDDTTEAGIKAAEEAINLYTQGTFYAKIVLKLYPEDQYYDILESKLAKHQENVDAGISNKHNGNGSARKVFCRGVGFLEPLRQKRHRGPQRPRARADLFPQSFSPGRTQMKLLADLHVHSRASLDGRSSVEALIETARTRGLSAITVSDHDLCTPLPDCKDLFLIPGVEITSANGHILGLFLDAPIDFAALGKFPPPAQAIAAIHASGGLAVLAHPFAPQKLAPEEIARLGFDAIETANARAMLKPGANEKARQLSQKLSLPGTGGSDAHCAKELGGCVTEFSCEPSPAALKEALKAGSCRAVEVRACKWVWKGLSKIRREQSCGTVLPRCKALCYFAACIARDVFHV